MKTKTTKKIAKFEDVYINIYDQEYYPAGEPRNLQKTIEYLEEYRGDLFGKKDLLGIIKISGGKLEIISPERALATLPKPTIKKKPISEIFCMKNTYQKVVGKVNKKAKTVAVKAVKVNKKSKSKK